MMSHTVVWSSVLISAMVLLTPPSLQPQDSVEGAWEGAIVVQGQEIGIIVHFHSADGALSGAIDVRMQGASGLPLYEVRFTAPSIHFEMLPGPRLATFDGTVQSDSIGGAFTQVGMSGTFWLKPREARAEEPG